MSTSRLNWKEWLEALDKDGVDACFQCMRDVTATGAFSGQELVQAMRFFLQAPGSVVADTLLERMRREVEGADQSLDEESEIKKLRAKLSKTKAEFESRDPVSRSSEELRGDIEIIKTREQELQTEIETLRAEIERFDVEEAGNG